MATAPNPALANVQARQIVTGNAVRMVQEVYSRSVNPGNEPILNIPVRNVGLILGFIVEVSGGVTNGASTQADRTGFGSANVVKNFTYTDLNNVQRINTSGAHIAMINAARQGFAFGGAYAPNLPMAFGNNWSPFAAPASLAAAAAGTVRHSYYVPLAYSRVDLRGSVYANIVNATQNLQVTLNATPFVGATDPFGAVYSGNANGAWTGNVSVKVYQIYLDQIPMIEGQPVLPMMDLNTIYDLKSTVQTGIAVGQDFPVPYANYRQFLSTMAVFNNGGVFNSGSDVNYIALQAANSTNLLRVSPNIAALEARQTFMADPPPGVYYLDHRDKPIDTINFGNMEFVLNASNAAAGSQLVMWYEAFAQANQLPMASSLSMGN